jgi:solute carrier family 39 (zinc transporter), member 1/2/3
LLAILAHKWAASFALAVQINKSKLSFRVGVVLFLLFSLMAPMGILAGQMAAQKLQHYTLLSPIFMSLAAGTFLYLGSLHGLEKSVMVKQCCNLKMFSFVILGFAIMALLALYT